MGGAERRGVDIPPPIGARSDYTSPVFTLSIGVLLGTGTKAPAP